MSIRNIRNKWFMVIFRRYILCISKIISGLNAPLVSTQCMQCGSHISVMAGRSWVYVAPREFSFVAPCIISHVRERGKKIQIIKTRIILNSPTLETLICTYIHMYIIFKSNFGNKTRNTRPPTWGNVIHYFFFLFFFLALPARAFRFNKSSFSGDTRVPLYTRLWEFFFCFHIARRRLVAITWGHGCFEMFQAY